MLSMTIPTGSCGAIADCFSVDINRATDVVERIINDNCGKRFVAAVYAEQRTKRDILGLPRECTTRRLISTMAANISKHTADSTSASK